MGQCFFPDGLIATVTANGGCTIPHQHVVRVYGRRGSFETTPQRTGNLWQQDGSRKWFPYALGAPKTALLTEFMAGVEYPEQETIEVCLAMERSLVIQDNVRVV